jgi:hypothetical protein
MSEQPTSSKNVPIILIMIRIRIRIRQYDNIINININNNSRSRMHTHTRLLEREKLSSCVCAVGFTHTRATRGEAGSSQRRERGRDVKKWLDFNIDERPRVG